jgi:V/A-type H+-transporting ATPase subunit K
MTIFDFLFMALPVVFLIASVLIAVKAVSAGKSRKRTLLMQLASFAAVFAICMVCPFAVSAATGDAAVSDGAAGMNYIAAAAATGLSCIGGGIAVGNAAPAAIGATSEDPKAFGKAIIFVALGEGIALYGVLVSMLIINS